MWLLTQGLTLRPEPCSLRNIINLQEFVMSRRPASELIMGELGFTPNDPKGNAIRLKALHDMLAAHPPYVSEIPKVLADDLRTNSALDLSKK